MILSLCGEVAEKSIWLFSSLVCFAGSGGQGYLWLRWPKSVGMLASSYCAQRLNAWALGSCHQRLCEQSKCISQIPYQKCVLNFPLISKIPTAKTMLSDTRRSVMERKLEWKDTTIWFAVKIILLLHILPQISNHINL